MTNRRFYFTDEGTCQELEEDAGRQRFARMPQQNHMPGGFADESNESDYLAPEQADPRANMTLRPSANARPAEYRGTAITPPDYSGRYTELPSASVNRNAGELGTSVVSGPRTDRRDIGFGGAPMAAGEYDPRTNTSVTQPDPGVLYSTTIGGTKNLRPDGMGSKASTGDIIKKINARNRKFYARDVDKREGDDEEQNQAEAEANSRRVEQEENQPQETKWRKEGPDGSVVEHIHRVTLPQVRTVDLRLPRRPPQLPRLTSDGAKFGSVVAHRVATGISTIAELNRRNREHYQR